MASIQQLEKLYQVHRLFQSDQSLESVVASQRVQNALKKTEQIIKQRSFLREERRRLRIACEKLEERKRAMKFMVQSDFVGDHLQPTEGDKRICINVGGLVFETYASVLKKDTSSLLSRLCDEDSPVKPDPDGCFVFNRDWWLFRYILSFLRDGSLPDDRTLLAQLYQEAHFWELGELMCAIEENKLHLRETIDKDGKPIVKAGADGKPIPKKFWQEIPTWWHSVLEAEAKAKKASEAKVDWWTTPKGSEPGENTNNETLTTWGETPERIVASGADER